MNDKHPEAITIHLGDRDRRLKLGPAAFRLAALKHGVELTTEQLSNPTIGVFAQLVWVGLLPDEPDLEELTVLSWLGASDNEGEAMAQVGVALERMTDNLAKAFDGGKPAGRGKKK